MNATNKELKEWIAHGKRAFKRVAPVAHTAHMRRHKVIRQIVHINGNVIEYDTVVCY